MAMEGPSPTLFFDTMGAFHRSEALRAAIEVDLFSQVALGHKTVEDLARACGAAPHGVRILADFLTITGFLEKEGTSYKLTADSRVFLDRASPAYVGRAVQFLMAPEMRQCFASLTEAVRRGGTSLPDEGTVSRENPIWVEFARDMAPLMHMPAQLLARLVGDEVGRPLRVLDVAAGHGTFGIAVAQRFPQSHITALDWPNVLNVAKENAALAGVASRHSLLPGSAFEVDWGGPYDVVLLTNFFHHFDRETCENLARKAYASLAPGGKALTLDFIPDANRVTPPASASFALIMLATTPSGDAYTFDEYQALFARAGFANSEYHALLPTAQSAVISHRA